ncbi:flagellar hook-length control protein FliK [Planktomarina temperata]|nr:flagellar hook-length control protein FliK [Planktomarina temperata]
MSISFSGVIGSANADWQLGLKGADDLRSDSESLFANFSIVLHSLSDGNPETLSENEKLNISIGNLEQASENKLSPKEFLSQAIDNGLIKFEDSLEGAIEEQGVDGLVGYLESGGNIGARIDLNATAAFVDSRLNLVSADIVADNSYPGSNIFTMEQLFRALNFSDENSTDVSQPDKTLENNLAEGGALSILTGLLKGAPVKLEVNDTGPSTILFDIRDLKVDLQDYVYPESDQKTNELITGEFLIPQVVPVKISNSDIVTEEFDPFIPVKVNLFDHQGDLGAFDIIDLPEQQDLVLGKNLMGVTKTVEIDPSVDPRSKLLVVLAIPNDTNLKELPDFVRFKINLKSYTNSEIGTGQGFEVQQFSGTADGVIDGSADIRGDAKALLHSLEEMSAFSSSATQIILKTTGMDVAGLNIDAWAKTGAENNKFISSDKNYGFQIFEENKKPIDVDQIQLILDQKIKLVAGVHNDNNDSVASSALALTAELKSFFKSNFEKANFISKKLDKVLVEGQNTSTSFDPKSFIEAAEVLRLKSISSLSSLPSTIATSGSRLVSGENINLLNYSSEKFSNQNTSQAQSGSTASTIGHQSSVNNNVSLYDAQYASRISMLVVDKVLNGQENFEINLEPESFGKIKVNILMDKQSLDIRMFAETQAAASILRANEDSLLQLTGQNGMKLASFSVGMQSGADQQRQNSSQNRNKLTGKADSVLESATIQNTQTTSSYRTPTGLNLIA